LQRVSNDEDPVVLQQMGRWFARGSKAKQNKDKKKPNIPVESKRSKCRKKQKEKQMQSRGLGCLLVYRAARTRVTRP
jgi:hypothetical protein